MSKVNRINFDNLGDLVAVAQKGKRGQESHDTNNPGFYGTKSFGDAVALYEKGWDEGAAQAAEIRASLDGFVQEAVAAKGREYAYDVAAGEWLDVGRYLGGEPECFGVTQVGESLATPVVRLVVNLAASGSVSKKSLLQRGAAALAAVDILESCGKRVELTVGFGSRGHSIPKLEIGVVAKSAGQPAEPDRLAYLLCHASFLRRIIFSVMEQHGHKPSSTFPDSYAGEDGQIVTPHSCRSRDFSQEELQAHIREICALCGVDIPAP